MIVAAALLGAPSARAASVEIAISNVRSSAGHVRVAICSQAEFLTPKCTIRQGVPSVLGTTVIRFDHVPPGEYAAQAYSDEHDWGEVRRDFFGLPENGVGFSNNAPMNFGPPKWEAARFSVGATPVHLQITLRYYGL